MDVMFDEKWDRKRWRKDSIYLQKYQDLVVPKERQELERSKLISKVVYIDDDHKRRDVRPTN